MGNKCPFTRETLLEYEHYKNLVDELQSYFLYLYDEEQLNNTGNLKRPASSFLLYRLDCLAEISDECEATPGSKAVGRLQQKDISPRARDKWAEMSMEEKEKYRLLAEAAAREMRKKFPYYRHNPVEGAWWDALTADGQKRFYFETVVRICKYLVYKSGWEGYLFIQKWAQLPEHAHYVDQDKLSKLKKKKPVATPPHADQGSSSQATASPQPHQQASHPYNDARILKKSKSKKKKGKLVHLGPRVPSGPEQTLELLPPQPQQAVAPVCTEVETPLGTPPDVVERIEISEGSIPQNASIVWGYTDPEYTSTPTPNTTLAQPGLAHDFIHQQPYPAYSPPAYPAYSPATWSTIGSGSSLTGNVAPIVPAQTELTNNAYGASHWSYPSYNFTAQSNTVASTASGLTLPPHEQMPVMGYIPAYSSSHAWDANYSAGPCYGYGALDDYSMAINVDAQYSWPPSQTNHTTPHLQTTFDSNPTGQMSQELQEYFDPTLQEHGGFWASYKEA